MTERPNSIPPDSGAVNEKNLPSVNNQGNEGENSATTLAKEVADGPLATLPNSQLIYQGDPASKERANSSKSWIIITAIAVMLLGLFLNNTWIGLSGSLVALLTSVRVILPPVKTWLSKNLKSAEGVQLIAFIGLVLAVACLLKFVGVYEAISNLLIQIKWDEFGSWAEWVGALGQILIAVLAVYVAWQQYVISKDLTIRQNTITQQQTIDAYFQGISDLALNDEGLLEDWPQERAIAEGRTAAILSGVDSGGKAKILRFLSQSKLLTPLMRDRHLGRPIFDGRGGYAEDRAYGIRVIDLGVMLAGSDLAGTDLRWTDLSEANMVRANLAGCDLVKANLCRTVLYEANLAGVDLKSTRLFYGSIKTTSPRSRSSPPNYETGAYTGAVIEKANFASAKRMSNEQRYYCCAWGGEKTRGTIPGGCEGIPNLLGR